MIFFFSLQKCIWNIEQILLVFCLLEKVHFLLLCFFWIFMYLFHFVTASTFTVKCGHKFCFNGFCGSFNCKEIFWIEMRSRIWCVWIFGNFWFCVRIVFDRILEGFSNILRFHEPWKSFKRDFKRILSNFLGYFELVTKLFICKFINLEGFWSSWSFLEAFESFRRVNWTLLMLLTYFQSYNWPLKTHRKCIGRLSKLLSTIEAS